MSTSSPSGRDVLRESIRGQRRDVAVGALLGSGHQIGEALVPVLIGVAIDQAVTDSDTGALLICLGVLAVGYVALALSFRFGAMAGERAAARAEHTLRISLVRRVLDPGGGAEDGRLPGVLANIATEDAKRVGAVNMAVMSGISALTGILTCAVVLLRMSPTLGLVVLLGTPVLLWLGHLLSKPLESRSEAEQERAAHASAIAADLVSGLRILKGIGGESAAIARYRTTSRDSLGATLKAARAQAFQSGVVLALTGCLIAVVALVGGRLAAGGSISLGELVSAVGLALFLVGPLETLSWVNAELAQGRASAGRVAEVIATPPAIAAGGRGLPQPVRGAVRLTGVRHGGLRGVDLDIAPGELLGVVATDPAHANDLMRCLARHTDPDAGTLELDGIALRDFDPAELRTAMLVAAHDADLFEGTVRENVAAAAPDGGDPEQAMAAAGVTQVAQTLADGEHTPVGERGHSLSGGQRQRVALARALAAERPVLVVHDPTTAVDAVTEARIAAGLREIRKGRTTVLVTTSPALLAVTDRVALLDEGRVTDTAPHANLIQRHEAYRTAVLS
ncbi:multidrug ABC transporter ATP-binding protein [Streptomyces longisporoflavus]|uniref:ABC transporter ATP-binding protein n=1 Tax=Streptomyces longisporoflavus TaxID=28044 RepID=UPI00167E1066|nr:ABC transporter ATP-binding protein [Streptomyces longisporoflavus]GGV58592.1 multidrug ABC transporter ATP-binding protein [Streptomyces longisporoflavus]